MREGELGNTNVAFTANHLLAVILGGKSLQRGLNDSTTKTKDQVESRLLRSNPTRNQQPSSPTPPFAPPSWIPEGCLLAVPSGCCSPTGSCRPRAAFRQRSSAADLGEFLPCPLLVHQHTKKLWPNPRGGRKRTDLGLDIVDGVGGLDLKSDGLTRQSLDEAGFALVSCPPTETSSLFQLTSAL